jgi:hypothetical protein
MALKDNAKRRTAETNTIINFGDAIATINALFYHEFILTPKGPSGVFLQKRSKSTISS